MKGWPDPPRCVCCCSEHTFEDCPARAWGACRGQDSLTRKDIAAWAKHYGMTIEEFAYAQYDIDRRT